MLIRVTQIHIDNGQRKGASTCPVSLALIEAGFTNVSSGDYLVTEEKTCPSPIEVLAFISRFDHRLSVEPFTFDFT